MHSAAVRDRIIKLVYESITELNEQRDPALRLKCAPTSLGGSSGLDSLSMVNLIALIEEKVEEAFNRTLVLFDSTEDDTSNPLESVGTLAEFIEHRLGEELV